MIDQLLNSMSSDMNITKFQNESDDSFISRICYSALGQWCLSISNNVLNNETGTTKNNQTNIINNLTNQYISFFPFLKNYLINKNSNSIEISKFLRTIYEETGYLITDNNRDKLVNYGRSIKIGNENLFFGINDKKNTINGLGVFSTPTPYVISINDFLIRDNLSLEDYFDAQFDPIDFITRDVDMAKLVYFNPLSQKSPSQSWEKNIVVNKTIAKDIENGSYYKIIQDKSRAEMAGFIDLNTKTQPDSFTSYEYRRLYFAIKYYYNNPIKIYINYIDNNYAKIKLEGELPNREYYFLLLLSWPQDSAYNKSSFIIKREFLPCILSALKKIGFEARRQNI